MKYDRATALHDNVTHVSEWTQRLKREYTDKRLMANIFTWSCKRWCAVQVRNSEKKCVAPVARILHRERKKKKNRIDERKRRKRRGEKSEREKNWKEEKGEGESVELYFFFFLVSTFLSWPLKRKVENTEWKTEAEIGKRATALFARLPNWFREETSEIINRLSSKNW